MALQVKPIVPKTLSFRIVGTSPLIQHAWSEKALRMLRMTAAERRKQQKVARDPEGEAMGAMYRLKSGAPAFPMLAFKAALIAAAHKDLGVEKTLVRKSLFIPAWPYEPGLLGPLEAGDPEIREDVVRVGNNQTDLRYRPEFREWAVTVVLSMEAGLLSEQDLVNLVDRAGFSVGVGEWRPEKGGEYGRFELDAAAGIEYVNTKEAKAA